ncbi:MAG: DUF4921 family protein [Actinomycetaceae bacterium]|nr:DUF4921 family protein [Actinomycetaceae bacterium]
MSSSDNQSYIIRMADGTIKQFNPFSGTEVWTVPGRANRPFDDKEHKARTITDLGNTCTFCVGRVRETPPEKARIVKNSVKKSTKSTAKGVAKKSSKNGNGDGYKILYNGTVDTLASEWEFRRIPNLFEIISYDYWQQNYGFEMDRESRSRMEAYIADPAGKAHLLEVIEMKLAISGETAGAKKKSERSLLRLAEPFFGGGHDVIVARRHYVDGAKKTDQFASAGTLTPEEHSWYMTLTIDAMRDLYERNRYARYVQVFQNWLKASGASFDHLHKQLVAIDERSVGTRNEIPLLRANPNIYNEYVVNYAVGHNLVVAENDHAIALAGFGHRYPTLEVWSRSRASQPWEHSPKEQRAMSDLVHAMHAVTGAEVPTNEEWYSAPIDLDVPMPWRILLKWRISTLAGFEGGSKIYVNTISPYALRDKVTEHLLELRAEGRIAGDIRIASECSGEVNPLLYNRNL